MPYAGYNMTANPVLNTKSHHHSKGMTTLLPDSVSNSDSVTDKRQMTKKNKTEQRTNPDDEADSSRDRVRVGRRFPGTTLTPQVI